MVSQRLSRAIPLACVLFASACSGSTGPFPGGASGGDDAGSPASGDASTSVPPVPDSGSAAAPDSGASPTLVQVSNGWLRGTIEGGAVSFRGIPYAAPPVGALRWARPAPPASWTGIRDATAYGAICPQFDSSGASLGEEDCLFVNVWAPVVPPSTPLPVIVFIHGGDWIVGAGSFHAYAGSLLAQSGPAVVVTLNYRLGALGFLALPDLAGEDPNGSTGDYGLLDQQAALAWVQQNIGAFGGDPARVTMWGQSAGGWSTMMHLASPLGRGLFSQAFSESGGTWARDLVTSENNVGAPYASQLGCGAFSGAPLLACMRAVPGSAALRPAPSTSASTTWGPVIDGYVLTEPVMTTFAAGRQAHVPLVVGTTSLEYGSAGLPVHPPVASVTTEAAYDQAVASLFGSALAPSILEEYPASAYASPQAAYVAMLDDWGMLCLTRRAARDAATSQTQPVWRYLYSHTDSNGPLAAAGPVHAADLPFWFGTFDVFGIAPDPAEQALSTSMQGYLARFAATGDPNGGAAPAWPAYAAASDPYMGLADAPVPGAGIDTTACEFWDSLP
jgi:para-nitrobenzyl esterase